MNPRLLRRGLAAAALVLAALPAAASADSIVFIKSHNVWLANADGTGQYQVTQDGTADRPWRAPSQADDGTIAAGHGDDIVRMRQNGTVLNTIDPPALLNSVGHPVDGPAVDVAISPDGARIAYTFASYECPVGASCGARFATGITAADRLTAAEQAGTTYHRNPSWVTSTRSLQFGGYGSQVNVHDVGQTGGTHWFDDADIVGQPDATDLGDGELNRQSDKIALVRGYGASTNIVVFRTAGPLSAAPTEAEFVCGTGFLEGLSGPSWAPDGRGLAWQEPDGVWVHTNMEACEAAQPTNVIPGGSEPDWGQAAVNPGAAGSGSSSGSDAGDGKAPPPAAATMKLARARSIKAIAARGLQTTVTCAGPCTVDASLLVDRKAARKLKTRRIGRAKRTLAAAGEARLTLKPARKVKRRLARLRKVTLTVQVTVTDAAGKQTLTRTVRVKR